MRGYLLFLGLALLVQGQIWPRDDSESTDDSSNSTGTNSTDEDSTADDIYYTVDLNHTEYDTLGCYNTSVIDLCFRNCSGSTLVNYTGITAIRSPTYNGTKNAYDLKQLSIVYDIGKEFMFACQRTSLFELISTIITEKWLDPLTNTRVMEIIEAELPWFIVIAFFTMVVAFLVCFVTFSIMDGVFGWTDSTRRQQMSPSNGTFVNVYGLLIILFTILVLMGCLFGFVGNLLVTENKDQAKAQLKLDYDWSKAYSDQGAIQLAEFIDEFQYQLLTKIKVLYNISIEIAVDNIYSSTQSQVEDLVESAKTLDSNLENALGLGDFALDMNASINIINSLANSSAYCMEYIPMIAEAYCTKRKYDTWDADSECWTDKQANKWGFKGFFPSATILNGTTGVTWPNVTTLEEAKVVESMINSSSAIKDAYNAKIYDDVLKGYARYKALKTTLLQRTVDNRTEFKDVVEQAKIMAETQLEAFKEQQDASFRSFTKAVQFPTYFFSESSPLASINNTRYNIFILVNLLSIITVTVGVFAWCVGCCNFNADQIPTSRAGKSHYPGVVIFYSSYVALFLSLFTITCGVVYFVPTSLFAFACDVYDEADLAMKKITPGTDDPNFFLWWDDHLIVDDNILGRYIHDDGDFDLTVHEFIQSCWKDDSLYKALKLDELWTLTSILGINETLRVAYFIEELQKVDFSDQTLMSESAAEYDSTLADTLSDLDFSILENVFSSSTYLFAGTTQDDLEEWMEYMDNWNDKLAKQLKGDDDYNTFVEMCFDVAITGEVDDDGLVVEEEDEDDDKRRKRKRRSSRKRRGWDDDDDDKASDYGSMGYGGLSTLFTEYMETFDSTYSTLYSNIQTAKSESETIYSTYVYLEPLLLETEGPTIVLDTIEEYEEMIFDEIDCFVILAAKQIEWELGQCRTIYDVLDGTMLYFCNFLVGPMTVIWMAFLMIGIGLTFYIQAARAVSMYFLRMDEIHPGDISQEDKVLAMKSDE